MTDDLDALADAGAKEAASVSLVDLKALAEEQLRREAAVDAAEEAVKAAKKALNEIALDKLPVSMVAAGVKSFTLDNGRVVSLGEKMHISVPKKRKDEIIKRLREMEQADLITNVVTVDVPRGKDNEVSRLMETAAEIGLDAVRAEDVNSGTLKALLTKRRESGEHSDDLAFFGAHVVSSTEIK